MVVGKALVGLCAATLLAGGSAAAQKPRITLQEAIARANLVQPAVVSAFGSVRTAAARQRTATAAFFPSLSLGGSFNNSYSETAARIDLGRETTTDDREGGTRRDLRDRQRRAGRSARRRDR